MGGTETQVVVVSSFLRWFSPNTRKSPSILEVLFKDIPCDMTPSEAGSECSDAAREVDGSLEVVSTNLGTEAPRGSAVTRDSSFWFVR